jgi:hypothetical protein
MMKGVTFHFVPCTLYPKPSSFRLQAFCRSPSAAPFCKQDPRAAGRRRSIPETGHPLGPHSTDRSGPVCRSSPGRPNINRRPGFEKSRYWLIASDAFIVSVRGRWGKVR